MITARIRAGNPIAPAEATRIRRRMLLEGCKWDAQVGDVSTLASFPLFMDQHEWSFLARTSENLAAELAGLERSLGRSGVGLEHLGMPPAILDLLRDGLTLSCEGPRFLRFDFHPTVEGWALSEVNADVPGGYAESSFFPALMSEVIPGTRPAGDPSSAVVEVLARLSSGGSIVLLSAPGFVEDHQVTSWLAQQLRACVCKALLATPAQLGWEDGAALVASHGRSLRPNVILRFVQAEWLPTLRPAFEWQPLIAGSETSVVNPGISVIGESKRLPLLWPEANDAMTTWKKHLPETRDPREVDWTADDGWVLKKAYANTGDSVHFRDAVPPTDWKRLQTEVRRRPEAWLAQRRFDSPLIDTPLGPRRVCIGVYCIDGRASGAYARLSAGRVVNFEAVDAPLLLCED